MNAFDRYPPKAGQQAAPRHRPSHRRQSGVGEEQRSRARGLMTLIVFVGVIAAGYCMLFIVGRSILHHRALAHPDIERRLAQ